jgi:hypothetical protein
MSTSIEKVESLLNDKNITPMDYYKIKNRCAFMKCLNTKTCSTFILEIPLEYKLRLVNEDKNVFKIKLVNLDEENDNVLKEYTKEMDDLDVIEGYDEKITNLNYNDFDNINITEQMNKNYNYNIQLPSITTDDVQELKDIRRQLNRLRLCIKQNKYSICITYKNFLCLLKPNSKIDTFKLEGTLFSDKRQMSIVCNIENLYLNISQVEFDIERMQTSIKHILDLNLEKNINHVKTIMDTHTNIMKRVVDIPNLKQKYNTLYSKYTRIYKTNNLKDETQNVVDKVQLLNEKTDNIALSADKIMFDNMILYNTIVKNYELLLEVIGEK